MGSWKQNLKERESDYISFFVDKKTKKKLFFALSFHIWNNSHVHSCLFPILEKHGNWRDNWKSLLQSPPILQASLYLPICTGDKTQWLKRVVQITRLCGRAIFSDLIFFVVLWKWNVLYYSILTNNENLLSCFGWTQWLNIILGWAYYFRTVSKLQRS